MIDMATEVVSRGSKSKGIIPLAIIHSDPSLYKEILQKATTKQQGAATSELYKCIVACVHIDSPGAGCLECVLNRISRLPANRVARGKTQLP